MPRWLPIGLLVLSLLAGVCNGVWAHAVEGFEPKNRIASAASSEHPISGLLESTEGAAPQKAYDLLAQLKQREGKPLPGYIGGRIFQNRERRLPPGRYREYDVDRKIPGRSRGAERLVIEQKTGKAYYTGDHYRSFVALN